MNNKLIYAIMAIAVALAVVLYLYFGGGQVEKVETTEEALDILSETPQVQVETNPVKKVPDLNPIEKINPFKTNNPFQ